jgi:hypothetical protein
MENQHAATGDNDVTRDPAPAPFDAEREAARVEAELGLAGQEELPSIALPAPVGGFPAGLARLTADACGRERLRLMFAEHPGLPLWLETSTPGIEVLAALEMEHGAEEPHPTAAEEAARAATSPALADFRRRWAAERRRSWTDMQAYFASPAHTAARDQTHAAMMDVFEQQLRRRQKNT